MRVLGLKRHQNFTFSKKKYGPKIFIFEYFSKIASEMNSTHPFCPILIPNTYVKFWSFFILFEGEFKGVWYLKIISTRVGKKIFLSKAKKVLKILYWVSGKCGGKTNFLDFFHRGIHNKKVGKSQEFSGMGYLKFF